MNNDTDILKAMEDRLSGEDRELLKAVYEPRAVAVPPENAWRSLCVSSGGELRCYGSTGKKRHDAGGRRVYISSADCGLSWKTHIVKDGALGAAVLSPYSGTYITVAAAKDCAAEAGKGGAYVFRSAAGFDDTAYTARRVSELPLTNFRQPLPLKSRKRWVCACQYDSPSYGPPVILYSDDDGETWAASVLKNAPRHEAKPPHRGVRWHNDSCEPTAAELSDGTLMVLARCSQDYHYVYYSRDGGESWTDPVPSRFHGTLTQPTLRRFSDGRLMLCWCNTQPLPELDHTAQRPPLLPMETEGLAEDVFTNRDANHAAVSEDDGKTWKGFREMGLNAIRNASDFRSAGGNDDCLDKSIHQFEIMELPFNKAMVVYGQHELSRKIVVFDLAWLYERERGENFRTGLANLSTQTYLKSVSGNFRGFSGHCAWNRTNGAVLAPDPDGNFEEALSICRIGDPRLFSPVQGAVWNFPASYKGEVFVRLRIEGEGLRLSLMDRWFNPIDTAIAGDAQITFIIKKDMLAQGRWTDITVTYDINEARARVCAGEKELTSLPLRHGSVNGLSYLHLQIISEKEDEKGAHVKSLRQKSY
jgi:hypothetical protein